MSRPLLELAEELPEVADELVGDRPLVGTMRWSVGMPAAPS